MKKILLVLIILFIGITNVKADSFIPTGVYVDTTGPLNANHLIKYNYNWYGTTGYNGTHYTYAYSVSDTVHKFNVSGIIYNATSTKENLSNPVVTFNNHACTIYNTYANDEHLWATSGVTSPDANDFNYLAVGQFSSFVCENVTFTTNNYLNVIFPKSTSASYVSYLEINQTDLNIIKGQLDQILNSISSTNQTIIEQNNQQIQQQQETNKELGKLNDNLTNSDAPSGMDSLNSASGWLPAGPVDSLLTLPLSMLNNISTSLGSSCTPINLPLPFVNSNLNLPCLNTIYSQIPGLGVLLNTIGTICAGFMLYYYFKKLYAYIDNLLSLKNNGEGWGDV